MLKFVDFAAVVVAATVFVDFGVDGKIVRSFDDEAKCYKYRENNKFYAHHWILGIKLRKHKFSGVT